MFMFDDTLLDKLDDGMDEVTDILHIECDDDDELILGCDEKHYVIGL